MRPARLLQRPRPRPPHLLRPGRPLNMDSAGQDINLNSPNKGLLSDSMTDVPVDTAVAVQTPAVEGLTEAEEEELRAELTKVLSWVTSRRSPARLMRDRSAGCALRKLPLEAIPGAPEKLPCAAWALYVPGPWLVLPEDVHPGTADLGTPSAGSLSVGIKTMFSRPHESYLPLDLNFFRNTCVKSVR